MAARVRKLLLIDDDVSSCRLVTALLRGELLDSAVAHDAASGKHAFAHLMPDLVLLDMHLPDGDGLGVLEDIRRRAPLTPVLPAPSSLRRPTRRTVPSRTCAVSATAHHPARPRTRR